MRRPYHLRKSKKKKVSSGADIFQRRILAAEILSTLKDNNFSRCKRLETKFGDMSEVVYAKPLENGSRYIIAVYTSCNQDGGAFIARDSGKDAIRVTCLYINRDGHTKGVVKNKRVNRVGDDSEICKRMVSRITKTFLEIKEQNIQKCNSCGAPMFTSSKGNLVCAEICWNKRS